MIDDPTRDEGHDPHPDTEPPAIIPAGSGPETIPPPVFKKDLSEPEEHDHDSTIQPPPAEKWAHERYEAAQNILMKLMRNKRFITCVLIFCIIFLIVLVFVILPYSRMELGPNCQPTWIHIYSRAFVDALGNIGITLLVILGSELLKYIFKQARKSKPPD